MTTLRYKGCTLTLGDDGQIVEDVAPGATAAPRELAVVRWYLTRLAAGADPASLPVIEGLVIEHDPAGRT